MGNKLVQTLHSGLNLTSSVGDLATMCHIVLTVKIPRMPEEDLDILTALESRAVKAGRHQVGIELDKLEVEIINYCFIALHSTLTPLHHSLWRLG